MKVSLFFSFSTNLPSDNKKNRESINYSLCRHLVHYLTTSSLNVFVCDLAFSFILFFIHECSRVTETAWDMHDIHCFACMVLCPASSSSGFIPSTSTGHKSGNQITEVTAHSFIRLIGDSIQSITVQVSLCNISVMWKSCMVTFGFCFIFTLTLKVTSSTNVRREWYDLYVCKNHSTPVVFFQNPLASQFFSFSCAVKVIHLDK